MATEKKILTVEGMSCEHCVNRIQKTVGALKGVSAVSVDLKGKSAAVEFDAEQVTLEDIKSAIEEQGYEVK
jgi:copper chaperone